MEDVELFGELHQQEENQRHDEYCNREYYWKVDYKGKMHVPTNINFHPNLWKGTEKDYDKILNEFLLCHEDEFKVIGSHKFDTMEEYNEKFKNLTA